MRSSRQFGTSLSTVAEARHWTSGHVGEQPDRIRDRVVLVVSELCTNALVHTNAGFELAIVRSDTSLRVEVTDVGVGTPTMGRDAPAEPHGRGLRIVDQLASDWGVQANDGGGKTVWARIDLGSTRAASS